MRDELRELTAGYVIAVVALGAWSAAMPSNLAVLALFFAGLASGGAAWILAVERRLPWPFRRGRTNRWQSSRSALVWFTAWTTAFFANEWARSVWPSRGEIYLDQPVRTISPDGSIVTNTFVMHYDIPLNAARGLIAFVGVFLAVMVIGIGIRAALDAWRGRERGATIRPA